MKEQEWIHCPVCGNKTRLRKRLEHLIQEPDAQTQSQ